MEIINLSSFNSVMGQYLSELRDADYQTNRHLFRNNITRIGQVMAYEISKRLDYEVRDVTTPLGVAKVSVPSSDIVVATILRAGLPFHQGFLNVFDHAGNGFVSAYRKYVDDSHKEVSIHVEYLACPDIEGKTLILTDPMLATGGSMELGYKALLSKGAPRHVHVACVIAAPDGIDAVRKALPDASTTVWCAAIDPQLNEYKYIVPGFGDAGDLCFGEK